MISYFDWIRTVPADKGALCVKNTMVTHGYQYLDMPWFANESVFQMRRTEGGRRGRERERENLSIPELAHVGPIWCRRSWKNRFGRSLWCMWAGLNKHEGNPPQKLDVFTDWSRCASFAGVQCIQYTGWHWLMQGGERLYSTPASYSD